MSRTSERQMEDDEEKIIRELVKDSRKSPYEIAKKCGFSRQKVWRIIKRFEKNKTIWGYHAVVDIEKLGMKHFLILAKKAIEPVKETADIIVTREIERKAKEIGIVIHGSHYLHGVYDWQICFTAENIMQAKRFCEALAVLYHPVIKELELLENIFTVKEGCIENPNLEKLKTFI